MVDMTLDCTPGLHTWGLHTWGQTGQTLFPVLTAHLGSDRSDPLYPAPSIRRFR